VTENDDSGEFAHSFITWLYPRLCSGSGLWHTTSRYGYLAIRSQGAILPNPGDRPFTFPQSRNSFGVLNGYVCLFDFAAASEKERLSQLHKWDHFFYRDDEFCTVAIKLDRDRLQDRLVPNRAARESPGDRSRVWIPYVEAWYPGAIPLIAIVRYLFIVHDRIEDSIELTPDDPFHTEIEVVLRDLAHDDRLAR
jgi:hypothetical protein